MRLTPREIDKLLIFTAAEVARRRRSRGLKLNYPEATALISAEVLEGIRDGRSVSELMEFGTTILTRDDVMEGIAGNDRRNPGRRNVSRRHEACDRSSSDSLGGSNGGLLNRVDMIPGEYLLAEDDVIANAGRDCVRNRP